MELVNVNYLGTSNEYQMYSEQDKSLINKVFITTTFGQSTDYIEYFIYDLNNEIVGRNYNAKTYSLGADKSPVTGQANSLYLDPELDARDNGFNRGSVMVKYNFFRQVLDSGPGRSFWIKQISTSRTEIKVARQDLANNELSTAFDLFNGSLSANNYYPDFYLNFGNDVEVIGINAVYLEEDGTSYILFKLYEPLPLDYDTKSQFWVVQKTAESAKFQVDIQTEAEVTVSQFQLRGPNYDIAINQRAAQTTGYYTYDSLFSTTVSSSYQQLQSLLDEKSVTINVDYSSFNNFIHFSSATERVNNFAYKVGLIEYYQSSSAQLKAVGTAAPGSSTSAIVSSSITALQQKIDAIITKFDGYEYYLYYTSASTAWPKRNSTQPYSLYSVTSSQAYAWLGSENTLPTSTGLSILYSASLYDNTNSDGLRYTAPTYIRDDENNQPYLVFLDMIGQHFDNIWIYYKDVTNRYSAENNPNIGVSLDLVGDALKGLGMQLYTNTNVSNNIYYSLLGINPDGSLLPPTGSEKITNYITSSIATLPALTLEEEVYKRLYHNLPYLLKIKGTERGVRALVACYGIPNSILTVNEFGGYNMYSQGDIQGIQDNKIYTGSALQLSSSLLSPNTSIQYYDNSIDKNSIDVEVGFSPADSINADITASLPTLSVQQLIGNPTLQYSSSYIPLQTTSNTYFRANYTSRYNVFDFIRIIKYYNNSLFKMIKDFVPARANLSTGIIIKSHILERNKYARYEPTVTTSSYNDNIGMLVISGSDAPVLNYSTAYSSSVKSLSGSVVVSNNYSAERYTGEFGGSNIIITTGSFSQTERSYQPLSTASVPQQIRLIANYQNVSSAIKSTKYFDLDYNTDQNRPVNFGLITQSINKGQAALNDQYAPYAELQDYNYNIRRSVYPRYAGSTTSGSMYNTYTAGDDTYGNNPVIDYYTDKLGLFTQVATSSFFPGQVNTTLAYLVDVSGGLFELNQNNTHWQDLQNIFKAGKTLTIKQFDNKKYSNQKSIDGIKSLYESGYSYTPILYFQSSSDSRIYFDAKVAPDVAVQASNLNIPNNYVSGSNGTDPHYPLIITGPAKTGSIYGIYDNEIMDNSNLLTLGVTGSSFPIYSVAVAGNYNIASYINLMITGSDADSGSFTLRVKKNGVLIASASAIFKTGVPPPSSNFYINWI